MLVAIACSVACFGMGVVLGFQGYHLGFKRNVEKDGARFIQNVMEKMAQWNEAAMIEVMVRNHQLLMSRVSELRTGKTVGR